jgi:hypothetical protein
MNGGHGDMVLVESGNNQELDKEWVTLIMNARKQGFSIEDVQKVLFCLKESGKDEIEETAV